MTSGGGSIKPPGPGLSLGTLNSRANTLLWTKLSSRANTLLWTIPLLVAIVSFGTIRATSRFFLFKAIEWTTQQPWLPSTDAQINYQTKNVTQMSPVARKQAQNSVEIPYSTLPFSNSQPPPFLHHPKSK
jgi:hypothetical protein